MGLENLENISIVSPSEYISETIKPIQEYSNDSTENYETMESFEYRIETPEFVSNLEMKEGISEYLSSVDEIKPDNWYELSLEQRVEVLNRIEHDIAAIEHRPPLKVELQKMKPHQMGYQSASQHKIVLNSLIVGKNEPLMHREVLDTIIHEGRHAYQHYNVDVKTIHESGSEVESWRENFYEPRFQYYQSGTHQIYIPFADGKRYDIDFRLYYYQPVETDARIFAADIISNLESKGIVCAKGEH